MVVRQQIERHRGNLVQQFVGRPRVGGGRYIVTMPAPDRRLPIPSCGNRENDRSGHCRSVACCDAPRSCAAWLDYHRSAGASESSIVASPRYQGQGLRAVVEDAGAEEGDRDEDRQGRPGSEGEPSGGLERAV